MTERGYRELPDDLVEPVLRMENPEWYETPAPAPEPKTDDPKERLRQLWNRARHTNACT